MAKQAAAPNPFAAATRKPTAAVQAATGTVITPTDITCYDGAVFKAAEVKTAFEKYIDGSVKYHQGDGMMKANRPTILAVARTIYGGIWAKKPEKRPDNPTMFLDPSGAGARLKVVFQNSVNALNEDSFTSLANLIGVKNAEKYTVKRDDFLINPDRLEQVVKVKGKDGKPVEMKVMAAIAEALQEKFGPSPEALDGLFHIVPKFETTKGLIDLGPTLLDIKDASPASANRLAQFLEVGRFVHQLKPGGVGEKSGEGDDD